MAEILYVHSSDSRTMEQHYEEKGRLMALFLQKMGFKTELIEDWNEPDYCLKCSNEEVSFNIALTVFSSSPTKSTPLQASINVEKINDALKAKSILVSLREHFINIPLIVDCRIIDQGGFSN